LIKSLQKLPARLCEAPRAITTNIGNGIFDGSLLATLREIFTNTGSDDD